MMCLSQTAGYAIHALGVVADLRGQACFIRDIAERSGIPKPYLAKIANQLSREGLVVAKRGYRGGIQLTRNPENISLLEVVEAIEGKDWISQCLLGMESCSAQRVCPTHRVWQRVRKEVRDVLSRSTLADILKLMGHGRKEEQVVEPRDELCPPRQRRGRGANGCCSPTFTFTPF